MLIKASERDRQPILDYCKKDIIFNIFIIGDIENFGFSSPYQDVWYEKEDGKIRGIALRYHNNLIVYSYSLDMDFSLINNILDEYNIDLISGKRQVIDKIEPHLKGNNTRNDLNFCQHIDITCLPEIDERIVLAEEKDAMDIAISYGDIKEFKSLYSSNVNERYSQISTRISSREGKHLMILDNGVIISHGNTTAENSFSGMIGGIFTRNEMRNKGYGTQIISALVKDLKSRNKEVTLFYKNELEGKLFKRLGFEVIGIWSTIGRTKDE